MPQDFNRSFEVEDGISLGPTGIFSGSPLPWNVPVINAPVGSRYFRNDNTIYNKIAVGDTSAAWEKVTRASFGAAPLTITFTGTTINNNDYFDVGKLTNAAAAQAVPYATILKAITVSYESSAVPMSIKLILNNVDVGDLIVMTAAAGEGVQAVSNLNINVPALTRIKLKSSGTGKLKNVVVNLVLEAVA